MNTRIPKFQVILTGLVAATLAASTWAGVGSADLKKQHEDDQKQSQPQSQPRAAERAAPVRNGGGAPRTYSTGPRNDRPSGNTGVVGGVVERNFSGSDPGRGYDHRGPGRPVYRPSPPRVVPTLPGGYRQYSWNGRPYYHYGNYWYRPYGSSFVVVGPPFGLFVDFLPGYYTSFWFGGTRYFYADDTYYLYDAGRRGYVVTESPYGDEREDGSASTDQADNDLYIYPSRGQSEQQQADDKYECHKWAADQTGYDPTNSDYDKDRRDDYLRAMTACLTGRGYSVK